MNEKELVEGLINKNEKSLLHLIQNYQDQIFRLCIGFVHNVNDAEELTQDVFIEAYNKILTFRQEAKLSTWLYRIAVNKSLNLLRKNKRNAIFKSISSLLSHDKPEIDFPDQMQKHPLQLIEMKEDAAILYAAIDSLPENQKTAFTLNKYEDMSYKEIAKLMDLSLSAVESLIHRAKLNLQKKLIKP